MNSQQYSTRTGNWELIREMSTVRLVAAASGVGQKRLNISFCRSENPVVTDDDFPPRYPLTIIAYEERGARLLWVGTRWFDDASEQDEWMEKVIAGWPQSMFSLKGLPEVYLEWLL